MALDLNTVSFLGAAIKLAWEIYDKGFKEEKSSTQRYIEFGDALYRLASNLASIQSIVEKTNEGLESERLGAFGPSRFDLTPLTQIIGNFKTTLAQCRALLNDETKFRQKKGVITNIIYNIDVDPEVIHLTERIAFHNTKIGLVLEPFRLHVQSQQRNLQKEQHQDTAEMISEMKRLMITTFDLKDEPLAPAPPRDLQVPIEISQRFMAACVPDSQRVDEKISRLADFSLQDGLEAFFHHFSGMSPGLDPMSYLRLMKGIWIMDRIRESNDWGKIQLTNPGGLYDRCVREMDRQLRSECTRVDTSREPLPRLAMLLQLPEESFTIWPTKPEDNPVSNTNHLGVLLDVPVLPDPKSHTLRIVRNIDGTLGVEDTTVTTTESAGTVSSERRIQTLNIEHKSSYFVPIYAMPVRAGSHPPAATVKLQSSRDGVNGIAPEFESIDHLLKLQHLMTGYKCAKRRNGVSVKSLTEGQGFPTFYTRGRKARMPKELFEYGNLQLWQRTPFEKTAEIDIKEKDRRASVLSAGPASPTLRKSVGSSMSFSSLGTTSSAHAQPIAFGTSGTAFELKEPRPPLLVLFLKQDDEEADDLLSFLVVELDELTKINPLSCDCRKAPKKQCTVSVIERFGGRSKRPLLARRFYAQGLNNWNLTAVGEHWPAAESRSVPVQEMHWLRINFPTESERIKFNNDLEKLVRLFTGRMKDYQKDLRMIRGTQIMAHN